MFQYFRSVGATATEANSCDWKLGVGFRMKHNIPQNCELAEKQELPIQWVTIRFNGYDRNRNAPLETDSLGLALCGSAWEADFSEGNNVYSRDQVNPETVVNPWAVVNKWPCILRTTIDWNPENFNASQPCYLIVYQR